MVTCARTHRRCPHTHRACDRGRVSPGHHPSGVVLVHVIVFLFFIEVPKGHPQPGSPKDGPCKGPNEVRLNTDAPKVHPLALFSFFFS